MASQSATAPQLAYLKKLGYRGPDPESKAAASALIDTWRNPDGDAI
jgi:hypothetical protein